MPGEKTKQGKNRVKTKWNITVNWTSSNEEFVNMVLRNPKENYRVAYRLSWIVKENRLARNKSYFTNMDKIKEAEALAIEVAREVVLAFLFRALSLLNLAPDLIEAILDGTEPPKLTIVALRKSIPADWNEQRELFCTITQIS